MTIRETLSAAQLKLLSGAPPLQSYVVYFRKNLQYGRKNIVAESAEHALQIAQELVYEHPESLDLVDFETSPTYINEIQVIDDDYNELSVWQDDALRLQIAAQYLLIAAKQVLGNWDHGDLAEAVPDLSKAVAMATGGAQ
jgi:hypothetical protein